MSEVPSDFIDEVKKCMCKFLWKGTPKIKYSVIIDGHYTGGITFPDFKSLLDTQRVMWIKRLIGDNSFSSWKIIPLMYLDRIGGVKSAGNNLNIKSLGHNAVPKRLRKYYHNRCGIIKYYHSHCQITLCPF